MSALKQAIAELRNAFRPLRTPYISAVEKIAAQMPQHSSGLAKRNDKKDYDIEARKLLDKIDAGPPIDAGEARDAAWCLWLTKPALAQYPHALRVVLESIERIDRKRPARALATSYLLSFAPGRQGILEASLTLIAIACRLGKPWDELQRRFALFDYRVGHENVARAVIDQRKSPAAVLQNAGLPALDARSDFAKASTESALRLIEKGLGLDAQARLELVKRLVLDKNQKLLFEDCGHSVANALTIPFATVAPERGVRDQTISLLTGLFGDPRLQPGRWARMREAETILRRWLTEQSLRRFLDIVDQIALERMWKYRRAFWEAVHRAGLIRDAWVVYDSQGTYVARRAFGKEASFGTFAGTVERGQTVLILSIGNGIAAEWSHNGKCVIWSDASHPTAPKQFQSRYEPQSLRVSAASDDLSKPIFAISHMAPETYSWQPRVAAKIHQMTGVPIRQFEYVVR